MVVSDSQDIVDSRSNTPVVGSMLAGSRDPVLLQISLNSSFSNHWITHGAAVPSGLPKSQQL